MHPTGKPRYTTYGANRQVDTLQVGRTEDVKASIDDTTLLARLHRTRAEGVPGGLDVVSDPVVDGGVVFLGVLDGLVDLVGVVRLARAVPCTYRDD